MSGTGQTTLLAVVAIAAGTLLASLQRGEAVSGSLVLAGISWLAVQVHASRTRAAASDARATESERVAREAQETTTVLRRDLRALQANQPKDPTA